jgi:hypothetical protein
VHSRQSPGGAGAGAGQGGNAFGELRQADFQAAIGLGQEGLVQADAFEQGNVFGGHGTLALGLVGAGGDGRQQGRGLRAGSLAFSWSGSLLLDPGERCLVMAAR